MKKYNYTYKLTASAALAAVSAAAQIVHLGWKSPWGMWIDVVAVPWILTFLLYGGRQAFLVSTVSALVITLFSSSTWLGASMKWLATLPMILIPWILQSWFKFNLDYFKKINVLLIWIFLGVIFRGLIIIPTNYYYAIPIWLGWNPKQAMEMIPWWIIFLMNAVQGILEVVVAWFLVFRFGLKRYASWE